MYWDRSTEKEEKPETKTPAALGERFVSSASTEQRCMQAIASLPNGSSFLTSITVK